MDLTDKSKHFRRRALNPNTNFGVGVNPAGRATLSIHPPHQNLVWGYSGRCMDKVWDLTKKIPRGRLITYGGLARALGRSRAARAVGNVLNKNRDFVNIPCHRVVRSDGQVGGYALGEKKKIEKLKREGMKIEKGKVVDLEKFLYNF